MVKNTTPEPQAQTRKVMRQVARDEYVTGLRDGRHVGRATTFEAKKGKGSYRRKGKHGKAWA